MPCIKPRASEQKQHDADFHVAKELLEHWVGEDAGQRNIPAMVQNCIEHEYSRKAGLVFEGTRADPMSGRLIFERIFLMKSGHPSCMLPMIVSVWK